MGDQGSDRTKSVAQLVRETIQMRPSITDALKMQIVNYSALARMLQTEIGEGSLEAVKAAIIRVSEELETEKGLQEEKVLSILRKSVVRLQDKIAVIISPKELEIPYIVTAYLTDSYVYVVDQTLLKEKPLEFAQLNSNLVALILISPPVVESTPGFVAFLSSLLSSREINIVEFISCSTNTVIVLDQKDALTAFSLLQNFT
ncbi:MAG: ACT domain-containing protein [Candidatus Bathyarchaeota archaeon]|nr:MAG: ACT domain-containing protein [Candidatus Bathyarchaeota archaeon]